MTTKITEATIIIPDGLFTDATISPTANIATAKLEQRTVQAFALPLSSAYTWDAIQTRLPGTPASDDLGFVNGTWGTDAPTIQTGDVKASNTTRRAGFEVQVPHNYDDGQTIELRVRAGMKTTISDTTATVDVEVYKSDGDGLVGSDLCTTAAQTINSLTIADKDFVISASGVDPGDKLFVRVSVAINDAATGTAVIGVITNVDLLCDTRG